MSFYYYGNFTPKKLRARSLILILTLTLTLTLVLVLVLVKRGVSNMLCDFFVWCFLLTIPLSLKFQVCTS